MDRIGIYINNEKYNVIDIAQKAVETLKQNNIEPVFLNRQLEDNLLSDIKRLPVDEFFGSTKYIIVLGGDGTILSVARRAAPYKVPIFGINAGRLGFLTEGDASSYEDLIQKLISGEVVKDYRLMLECTLYMSEGREETFLALNDIVIRNTKMLLMQLEVTAADHLLEDFRADGLIIATPTGSTAYSLSASGPIVHPSTKTLIVNPICPQNLNNRPFIIPDETPLTIRFDKKQRDIVVSMDGQDNIYINGTDYIEVKMSKFKTRLLRLADSNFFERVRSKLYDIR